MMPHDASTHKPCGRVRICFARYGVRPGNAGNPACIPGWCVGYTAFSIPKARGLGLNLLRVSECGEMIVAAETEVENALHEILESLRAELIAQSLDESEPPATAATVRLENYLAVTERAWNRLPPVASDRRGWKAKAELWIKRLAKRSTRSCAWEQVYFNSSVNGALHATKEVLAEHNQRQSLIESRLTEVESGIKEGRSLLAELERLRCTLKSDK